MKAIEEDLGLQELCETLRYKIFFQRVSVELRDYSRDDNKSSVRYECRFVFCWLLCRGQLKLWPYKVV